MPAATTTVTTSTDPNAALPPAPVDAPATTAVATPTGAAIITTDGGETDVYAWSEKKMPSGIGVSALLGGGVSGFTDKTMRNSTSNVGGLWDLRVAIGSHLPLALELGYIGTATNINGLPAARKGTLIGSTAEADVRWNILPHAPVTPYIFGGVGWQRYDVVKAQPTLADSGMNDHDNLLEFPAGLGVAYRSNGLVADIRGTFRTTTDQNLVLKNATLNPTSDDFATMHTWEAGASIGYEF
ncbi:MAG TPA: hypothetical protein VGC42_22790 [Kofleriaceae bacterium]